MHPKIDLKRETLAAELRGSLLEFTKTFFKIITGRDFIVSQPIGRESHHIVIAKSLTRAFRLQATNHRLIINVPPGHTKSLFVSCWVAWCFATYPDCNFLYISYSKTLATKHTEFIRRIMSSNHYQYLFDVKLRTDSQAKDLFKTTLGGTVAAFGTDGAITGEDGGLPGLNRFSGAVIIDDAHKPKEVHSDTTRENVINNYHETIKQRKRGEKVPFVFIGQRLHENDLASVLINGEDGYEWEQVILKSIDGAGNTLFPETFPKEMLYREQKFNEYVFSAQYQQDPLPAGGGIFKKKWFVELEFEPVFIATFITVDTAETDKSWNDATVFSFWGLYQVESMGQKTDQYALHWIHCVEVRIEPKDLEGTFMEFYADCMHHKKPPDLVAIEKKSTGVTLASVLDDLRGISIRKIERTRASGSKTSRFLDIQPFIARKSISFTEEARHAQMCIKHMGKITANNTHMHDDIADTCADAINIALIEKSLHYSNNKQQEQEQVLSSLREDFLRKQRLRKDSYA